LRSDVNIDRTVLNWEVDNTGYQTHSPKLEKNVPADIYFNNAGFYDAKRTYSDGIVKYKLRDDKGEIISGKDEIAVDYSKNEINYNMGRSTRLYGGEADLGIYENGYVADDIYDWFIRLPGIGNAICDMWDKVYGTVENGDYRYVNKAKKRQDSTDHLVTYDKTTTIGMMNTI
jgi:hypothetical protein